MGLGLNIVVGYAGLLDLGYVAFFAVGAYATAMLTGATRDVHRRSAATAFGAPNFCVALPIVMIVAALVGRADRRPGASAARRLPGHRHPRVRRDRPDPGRVRLAAGRSSAGRRGMSDITDAGHRPGLASATRSRSSTWSWCSALLADLRVAAPGRAPGSGGPGSRCARTRWSPRPWASAPSSSSCWPSPSGRPSAACRGALRGPDRLGLPRPASTIIVSITVLAMVILGGMGSIPGVVSAPWS